MERPEGREDIEDGYEMVDRPQSLKMSGEEEGKRIEVP